MLSNRIHLQSQLESMTTIGRRLSAAIPITGDPGTGRMTLASQTFGSENTIFVTAIPKSNLGELILAKLKFCCTSSAPEQVVGLLVQNGFRNIVIRNADKCGGIGLGYIGRLAQAASAIDEANRPCVAFTASARWHHLFALSPGSSFEPYHFIGGVNAHNFTSSELRTVVGDVLHEYRLSLKPDIGEKQLKDFAAGCKNRIASIIQAVKTSTLLMKSKSNEISYNELVRAIEISGAGRGNSGSDVEERTIHSFRHYADDGA